MARNLPGSMTCSPFLYRDSDAAQISVLADSIRRASHAKGVKTAGANSALWPRRSIKHSTTVGSGRDRPCFQQNSEDAHSSGLMRPPV